MDVSTKHLRAFTALAAQRNFTRAAKACHLSQPAFSAVIQAMEKSAGAKLFHRTTRSVELTHEGRIFEKTATRLLSDFEVAYSELKDHVQLQRGRVAVAALPSIAVSVLPKLLYEFRQKHPRIDLEVHDALSDRCIEMVQSGAVDMALAAGAGLTDSGLTTEVFCRDNFFVVCHKNHPLASQKTVKPSQLVGQDFIQLAQSTSIRQRLDSSLQSLAIKPVLEVEHLATVAAFVKANLGVSVIPTLALYQFNDELICIKPLAAKGYERDVHIIRGGRRPSSVAAEELLESFRRARTEIRSQLRSFPTMPKT